MLEFVHIQKTTKNIVNLKEITKPIHDDLNCVDKVIKSHLSSDIPVINQISTYILNSGGKKMRPIFHLLLAGLDGEITESNHDVASIIEFIHTATLLHDDVVDQSTKRRNIQTANAVFGNSASILVGDFLYSRSFQMMVKIDNMNVMKVLADATNKISEGEVLQLINSHNPQINESQYFEVIEFKTAKLFEACGKIAAIINKKDQNQVELYSTIGKHFGIIFQLADDILDYSGNSNEIGKNIGDDLREGKVTLPLILTIKMSNSKDREILANAIKTGDINYLPSIVSLIKKSGAIDEIKEIAKQRLNKIEILLDGNHNKKYQDSLLKLARFSLLRSV
jgi:octaprenyl-diphosphate synthase